MKIADTDILLGPTLLASISRKKARLDRRRPLPPRIVRRLHAEYRLHHTYNSNAIEGNSLTEQETRLVLEDGITVGGKTIREHLEATGNAAAFDRLMEMSKATREVSMEDLLELHGLAMSGIIPDAGMWRMLNVRIVGSPKSPPDWSKVPRLVSRLLEGVNGSDMHPVAVCSMLHHGLAAIHPFSDGNGRMARLAANLFLVRNGYPPIVLKASDRRRYYRTLAQADRGDLRPFTEFVARAVDESLAIYLSAFGGQDALVPLSELARGSPYSQEYLSLRARQGKLEAVKAGRSWMATKRALKLYIDGMKKEE